LKLTAASYGSTVLRRAEPYTLRYRLQRLPAH